STNGTYVNGQRVSTVKLSPSDQLKLGRCTLSYDYRIL
ncbi:MAG: FHA domain-containing protein, partial [Myxococcota bacterium]|nr:FHA domain-containing protein [Myxococcota bacterium]